MKFIIKKDILIDNLLNVSKAISSKNLIPILSGIKFELKEEGLYLSASDTDISIKSFIDSKDITKIENEGSIVIGGKYIVELIRKLPNTEVAIEVTDGYKMLITTENSEFNLNGINPNEFPNLYLELTKDPITINTLLFKNVVNQTSFATSTSETRPILTGINFKIDNQKLDVIATDSYRLAKKSINIDVNTSNIINVIIPCRNVIELTKIINDDNENIEMHLFNNKVLFKYKNILFQSRLLSGTYPANSNVIPSSYNISVECNLDMLYGMIDRAALLTNDKDKNTIRLSLNGNELMILSNSPEIGRVEEKMDIINDKNIDISFSSKYMMEGLKSFNADTVIINMIDNNSPIVLTSKEDESLVQLILPIKTY